MNKKYEDQVTIDIVSLINLFYARKIVLLLVALFFLLISYFYTSLYLTDEAKIQFNLHKYENLDYSENNNLNNFYKNFEYDDLDVWNDYINYIEYKILFKKKDELNNFYNFDIKKNSTISSKDNNDSVSISFLVSSPENDVENRKIRRIFFDFMSDITIDFIHNNTEKAIQLYEISNQNKISNIRKLQLEKKSYEDIFDKYFKAYNNQDYSLIENREINILNSKIDFLLKKNELIKEKWEFKIRQALLIANDLDIETMEIIKFDPSTQPEFPDLFIEKNRNTINDVMIYEPMLLAKIGYRLLNVELSSFSQNGVIPFIEKQVVEIKNNIVDKLEKKLTSINYKLEDIEESIVEIGIIENSSDINNVNYEKLISLRLEQVILSNISIKKEFYWILGLIFGFIIGATFVIFRFFYSQLSKSSSIKEFN